MQGDVRGVLVQRIINYREVESRIINPPSKNENYDGDEGTELSQQALIDRRIPSDTALEAALLRIQKLLSGIKLSAHLRNKSPAAAVDVD